MRSSYLFKSVIALLFFATGYITGRSGSNPGQLQSLVNPKLPALPGANTTQLPAEQDLRKRASGFQNKFKFALMLNEIPDGEVESCLAIMAEKMNGGRLTSLEIELVCEWIADRDPELGLKWLEKIDPQVLRSNKAAKILFRFIAANDASMADALLNSETAQLYGCTVDIYEGLLTSSQSKSEDLFMRFANHLDVKGNRQIVAEMQYKKMSAALLAGGLDAAKTLLMQGTSSSKDLVDNTGTVINSIGGINGNLNFAFFKAIENISPVPATDILDTLRQTSWFGVDKLETITSLEYLAKIDGKLATEQAMKMAASSPNGNMYINSAFTTWAQSDELAALKYLNSTSLNAAQQLTLVEALHQTTTTRAVREETTQILLSHGMRLPDSPPLKD